MSQFTSLYNELMKTSLFEIVVPTDQNRKLYRLARRHKLNGAIQRTGFLETVCGLEGRPSDLQSFMKDLLAEFPDASFNEKPGMGLRELRMVPTSQEILEVDQESYGDADFDNFSDTFSAPSIRSIPCLDASAAFSQPEVVQLFSRMKLQQRPPIAWTVSDVQEFLDAIGLHNVADRFLSNQIDGQTLCSLGFAELFSVIPCPPNLVFLKLKPVAKIFSNLQQEFDART